MRRTVVFLACAALMTCSPKAVQNSSSVTKINGSVKKTFTHSLVLITNQSAEFVQVYDDAFLVGIIPPKQNGCGILDGVGYRFLKIQSSAWTTRSETKRFEDEPLWHLTIALDGEANVGLHLGMSCKEDKPVIPTEPEDTNITPFWIAAR